MLREENHTAGRKKSEILLLRPVQECMVEFSSGAGQPESLLQIDLSILRKGVHKLWKQQAQILLPPLLHKQQKN